MTANQGGISLRNLMIGLACFVVVVAGMKAATSLLVPFLLALFISIIFAPPLRWLSQRGLPSWLSFIIVIVVVGLAGSIVAYIIGNSINGLTESLPEYQARLQHMVNDLVAWLEGMGVEISPGIFDKYFNTKSLMLMAAKTLSGLSQFMTNAFLVLVLVALMLLEASTLNEKITKSLGGQGSAVSNLNEMTAKINHYMALKTIVSLITGAFVCVWLWVLGVDYPLMWGMLAFFLNYVPNIGSIIAAVPAVLLALVQAGPAMALWSAGGYLIVNLVVGNVVEPKLMGQGMGLSPLVVFLSLIFWGWVLGPVGMLLSVPLTMVIKIALASREGSALAANLLGS